MLKYFLIFFLQTCQHGGFSSSAPATEAGCGPQNRSLRIRRTEMSSEIKSFEIRSCSAFPLFCRPCLLTQGWSTSSWDRDRSGGAEVVVVVGGGGVESVLVVAGAGGNAGSGGWREAAWELKLYKHCTSFFSFLHYSIPLRKMLLLLPLLPPLSLELLLLTLTLLLPLQPKLLLVLLLLLLLLPPPPLRRVCYVDCTLKRYGFWVPFL